MPDWLQPAWNFLSAYPIVLLPLLILLAYLAGKGLQSFLSKGVKRLTARTKTRFDDQLIEAINKPVLPTMIVLALLVGTNTLQLPDFLHNLTVRINNKNPFLLTH